MEAREIRYIMIEDKQGENGEFIFTLNIPINATWEMSHQATANFCHAIKELEERNKAAQEAIANATPGEEAAPVEEEAPAEEAVAQIAD